MRKIGRYQITGLLGTGGMGRVYKAVLPVVDKVVALKHLNPHAHMKSLLGEDRIEALFCNEARILANLRHPSVAALLDFDYDSSGRPFFVMEYLCMNLGALIGETYEGEKTTRRLPPDRAFRYIRQVLDGLARLHHAGIVHRDIKPFNVLLTDDDRVKIIDLGLSRLRGEVRGFPETFKIGTPFYAPPEQEAAPEKVDERADLYSTGVMLWRMLTGTLPPENEAPKPPGSLNPMLGSAWDAILQKAIQKDAQRRFPNCRQMSQAVDEAFDRWQHRMAHICRQKPAFDNEGNLAGRGRRLRDHPLKVPKADAMAVFGLDEWHRPRFQPKADYRVIGPQAVLDTARHLLWQQSGSPYPLSWEEAAAFINRLNRERLADTSTWRMPTVEELITLLKPRSVLGDYCQPDVFDPDKSRIWSSDAKSFTSAWMVDTEMGFVASHDRSCRFYVRAVASACSINDRISEK